MAEVLAALRLLLRRHAPYPAAAFDARWDLVMANEPYAPAVSALLAAGADPAAGPGPVPPDTLLAPPRPNLLRYLCHPDGARRVVRNWEEATRAILARVRREARHGRRRSRRGTRSWPRRWPCPASAACCAPRRRGGSPPPWSCRWSCPAGWRHRPLPDHAGHPRDRAGPDVARASHRDLPPGVGRRPGLTAAPCGGTIPRSIRTWRKAGCRGVRCTWWGSCRRRTARSSPAPGGTRTAGRTS